MKKIGLDVNQCKMAVLVQEMINSDRSGVIFTRNPANNKESIIESVHGLNQGMVDGIIEPDRWILDMNTGKLLDMDSGFSEKAKQFFHRYMETEFSGLESMLPAWILWKKSMQLQCL